MYGDLVEQNDNNVLNRKMLNQTSREMWEAASQALKRLDNKVPYIIAAGNHDYGYKAAENGRTYFFLIIFLLSVILPGGISVSVNFLIVKAGRL